MACGTYRILSVLSACTLKPNKKKHPTLFQAKQRQAVLEQAVSEAQNSESRITNFQNWIHRTDESLHEHLENDTTMDDLPHDFQVGNVFVCAEY